MNRPVSTRKIWQIRFGRAALLCLLTLGVGLIEYQLFAELETDKKAAVAHELSSIGQLKAGQLAAFLKERRGDSLVITDLLPVGLTQSWWDAKNKNLPASLQLPLKSAVAYYDYAGAMILDSKGNVRFRIGHSMGLSETTTSFVQEVLQTAPPPFSEIYAVDQAAPEQLILDTFAPIKSADNTQVVGVLVLRGNWPDLFAMIQSWPVKSRTAETLLVKHDSSQVIVLNELRHKPQTSLTPHMPIKIGADAPPWPIIKAAQGQYGPLESFDYRGQAVLAHVFPVQGAPWNLVVKVDTGEVLEHLRFLQLIAAAGTLITAAGLGLWAHNWQRKREQARSQRETQQLEHRLAAIIDSAMDAIISVGEDQRIVLFNPTAEGLFGCAAQEAIGQPLDRFIPHRFRDAHREHVRTFSLSDKTTRKMGMLGTVSGLRANGEEFPLEASVSQTQTDGQTLYTVILRDITERKKAFELEVARVHTLRQLSELGLQLSGTPDEIFRHIVHMIGKLFAVRVVCLSEIVGRDLSFRAVYVDGEVFSNAGGCPLDVTPCATVEVTRDLRLYDKVTERFPHASFLRDHKAYAYCGFPSLDRAGHVVAVSCLLDDKPREFSEEDQGILRIIGQRIATELGRVRAEKSLQVNEARLKEAQRLALVGSWELDLDSSALTWSDEIFRIFEIDPAKFGASYEAFLDAIHPEDRDRVNNAYITSVQTRKPYEIVHRLLLPGGQIKYVQERCQTSYDEATGKPLRSTGTVQDITALKQAEWRLEASLREKETLLREVHHRVKNNLQIISSLLHFQAKKAQSGQEQSIFAEGQDRLRAMILVHELLYRSTDLHRIPLSQYLKTLTNQLRHTFRETASRVHLLVETDDLSVPAAIALPCGMIVTELVTNAFKYAYPTGTSGPVLVRLASGEGSFLLSVSDEGTGLPAELDLAQASSFGLQLVTNLANQLGATLIRQPGAGTKIVLEVPLPSEAATADRPTDTPVQPFHRSESLL